MADSEGSRTGIGIYKNRGNGSSKALHVGLTKFFVQFPDKLHNHLKAGHLAKARKFILYAVWFLSLE